MNAELLRCFRLAKDLNNRYREELKNHKARFRGSLNSISLISLKADTPQLGFRYSCSKLETATDIEVTGYLQKLSIIGIPGRPTPEKELQSWIIKSTLPNEVMPFDSDIAFVTDEFARKVDDVKLVADIIGYNTKKKAFSIIELKSSRAHTRLEEQLDLCEEQVERDRHFYHALLELHGFEWKEPFRIEKIAVWPCSKTKQLKRFKNDIREICYSNEGDEYFFSEIF